VALHAGGREIRQTGCVTRSIVGTIDRRHGMSGSALD